MWIHFLLWVAVTVSAEKPLYRKIGDKAVLRPDSVENPIDRIRWKHGSDIAIEWFGYEDKTFSYRQFKDRGLLNVSTGALTITGLTRGDSGNYTAEINNRVPSKTLLLVISPVPKPTISVSCDAERTYCVFTCIGSITGAEPVTYRWTAGDKRWTSTKELNITKEEEQEWFRCTLENRVSSNSSEKVFKPFMKKELLYRKIGDKAVLTPDSVENLIYSIRWKHEHYTAMEWYQNGNETLPYLQFKDRGSLNILTGVMTITGLTRDDSGIYTAEINNKANSQTELRVNSSWTWLYILVAVVGVILVVCFIIILYFMYKCRKDLKPQWQYERASGGWCVFGKTTAPSNKCSVTNDYIEKRYQKKPHHKMPFTLNGDPYELDFEEMIQTNLETKAKCKIQRAML